MVVIFKLGAWYTEERLSTDELKNKAAKTPDIKGFIDGAGKNQLGRPKSERRNGLRWRVRKEVCCFKRK